jgi:trimeric autotransporter adhesin
MNTLIQFTPLIRNSTRRSPLRLAFLSIPLLLACLAFLPRARAATPENLPAPAPDGFYNGFNTAEGFGALFSLTTGTFNTALGFKALNADTSGGSNTAVGAQALLHNNLGSYNTAVGENALVFNTGGSFNMALGQGALATNTGGNSNTAMGFQALNHNTVSDNTAVGYQALFFNTTGGTSAGTFGTDADVGPNTAIGAQALVSATTSSANTAVGYQALSNITTGLANEPTTGLSLGGYNTAVGFRALVNATSDGQINDAFGYEALANATSGKFNVAIGAVSLYSVTTGHENTAVGSQAGFNITGSHNTVVGEQAGSDITGSWNIDIGSDVDGAAADSFVTRIGRAGVPASQGGTDTTIQQKCFVGGIYGVVEPVVVNNVFPVFINSAGQLGTQPPASSARFKRDIKPMDKTSEGILAFKPVTFHYKSDAKGTPQFGLIAEEVAKVNPDLVVRDDKGEVYSVRYDAVNAMLLNEFLKEHRKVEQLKNDFQATVAQEQKEIQALTAQLKEQASQIQKVSAQLEVSKSAPKTVLNNQ